jgi:hypothetical protein
MISIMKRAAARFRRWREDRVTMLALERLDERSRHDLEALVRRHEDAAESAEYDSKGRSVPSPRRGHIAVEAANDHAFRRVRCP